MLCWACQRENPDDAAFCGGCGGRLELRCASCGRANTPESCFCNGCGQRLRRAAPAAPAEPRERRPRDYTPHHLVEKILTQKSALEGERKQVTVLFADLKGSMELSEGIDAEEWHRVMDRFFAILSDGVHRFEGTINQFTGDGIMALFGAPIAHEDHAHRACYAALHLSGELRRYAQELKRERGLAFSVRMGLNSGEVVVGKIGDDLRMDYTAQGHSVGLAEREKQVLQTAAVIGREFSEPLLQRVADLPAGDLAEALHRLRAAEFIFEESLYPQVEYAFKHPLTQEVAYGSQLGSRRAAVWAGVSDPTESVRHWQRVRALLGEAPESEEMAQIGVAARVQLLQLAWRVGEWRTRRSPACSPRGAPSPSLSATRACSPRCCRPTQLRRGSPATPPPTSPPVPRLPALPRRPATPPSSSTSPRRSPIRPSLREGCARRSRPASGRSSARPGRPSAPRASPASTPTSSRC